MDESKKETSTDVKKNKKKGGKNNHDHVMEMRLKQVVFMIKQKL